jgi:hypothetical protein
MERTDELLEKERELKSSSLLSGKTLAMGTKPSALDSDRLKESHFMIKIYF